MPPVENNIPTKRRRKEAARPSCSLDDSDVHAAHLTALAPAR